MNKKINIYLMNAIVFLQGLVFYGPIATVFRQNRHLSLSELFLIESISWILMIMFEVPWGWIADRIGYKKSLVISNIIFFISKIVFYKAYSFEMFLLERALLSFSLAGISGCDAALIYSSVKEDEGEKVFGKYNAFATAGYLAASLAFPLMIKKSYDSTAFWTIIPYGIAAILSFFLIDVNVKHEEKPGFKSSVFTALKNKSVIMLVISFALISEVVQVISVFLNQSQYLRCGIALKYFGILAVLMQVVRLSSAKSYSISVRLGKYKTIQLLCLVSAGCCAALVFSANAFLTVAVIAVICCSGAIISPIVLDIENKSIKTFDRATLLSVYAMFGDLISAGINVAVGRAAQASAQTAFTICGALCVIAWYMCRKSLA